MVRCLFTYRPRESALGGPEQHEVFEEWQDFSGGDGIDNAIVEANDAPRVPQLPPEEKIVIRDGCAEQDKTRNLALALVKAENQQSQELNLHQHAQGRPPQHAAPTSHTPSTCKRCEHQLGQSHPKERKSTCGGISLAE